MIIYFAGNMRDESAEQTLVDNKCNRLFSFFYHGPEQAGNAAMDWDNFHKGIKNAKRKILPSSRS